MQIFRVHPEHEISARYLDNRRLSKQVLELYQIIRVCLAEIKLIEGNTRYLHHPIVKHVYHEGQPYIMDTFKMLEAMDKEHRRRGGKRSQNFREDLKILENQIVQYETKFNSSPLPPIYVYGDDKLYGEEVYEAYKRLLELKWKNDTIAPRCNIIQYKRIK
ncbi:hypothetical protein ETH98_03480 [Macrococcoides caseolyticum]|uniref:pyrimidine dimer DNA glycosylase/endonuclease V n=1 Tax=Macrococcoides caseolyticum TaxID=69966 RepID=UPI00105C39D1|nr:pyrimidine dimer DNA glycosylase/endonuclease V [Macrococcus caseolyticus]TDM30496.1 hypothetical protein ETH98_03480 [Macrococcus caseolyticus]